MGWEVEYTEEFNKWWEELSAAEQEEISAKVELLEEVGPALPRPHADTIASSRHANMKELRGKVKGRQSREQTVASIVRLRPSPHCAVADWW